MKFGVLMFGAALVASAPALAQDIEAGSAVFKRCMACHNAETDVNKVGPSLKGLFGRTAGTLPGYAFSKAMKDAGAGGLVWDEAAFTDYIISPRAAVPGSSMAFAGLKKPEDIANLIAYLKQFP